MANTKRALLGSVLAIVACVAMLIGSTFAWFTDTAGTAVNKIQAGRLDVVLEMKIPKAATDTSDAGEEWVSAEGKVLEFKKAAGHDGEAVLWEPGCRYELPQLRIRNNGNLALKYRVIINGIKGDAKLNEAIDWTIGDVALGTEQHLGVGASNEFTIRGVMKTDAGNEYQGLSIEGISIKVYAAQDTVESDSFGNTYDENAQYVPSIVDGDDAAEKELTKNEENINVILSKDVTFAIEPWDHKPMGGSKTKSIVIDGNGHKLTFNNTDSDWNNVTWGDAALTIKNAVIDNSGYNADGGTWNGHDITFKGSGLLLENVTFINAVALEGTATLKNVTISDKNATGDTYMLWIRAGSTVTAEDLTIDGKSATGNLNRAIAIKDQYIADPQPTTLTINSATITSDKYAAVYVTSASATTVDLKGTIDVTGTAVNDKVVQIDSGNVTVNDNSTKVAVPGTQEELNDAIANATGPVAVRLPEKTTFTLDNDVANNKGKRDITFAGDGSQTVDVITNATGAEGGQLNYQRGSTFTFENVKVAAGEGSFDGIVCDELIYKNCTITGKLTLYGKATFIDCVFENTMANQYSIWTWGGTDVTFEGCTFNTNGKAILLYGQATAEKPTNLVVKSCTFNDRNNGAAGKAALEIGNDYNATYTLTVEKATVNGFADGKNTGSKLWANKNSMDAAHLTVTIDGTKVQ